MMYQQIFKYIVGEQPAPSTDTVKRVDDGAIIPCDPANTDYQQFKQAINDDTAQLQDADGTIMSAEDAKQFVASLP